MLILTTTNEIRRNHVDPDDAQLWVHVYDGEKRVHSFVLASGPRADIEDYVGGLCSLDGLHERWVKQRRAK